MQTKRDDADKRAFDSMSKARLAFIPGRSMVRIRLESQQTHRVEMLGEFVVHVHVLLEKRDKTCKMDLLAENSA